MNWRDPLAQRPRSVLALLLNALASIHIVWFYVNRVQAHLNIVAFEDGRERLPFQQRMMMMAPMRWAHHSAALHRLAAFLTGVPGWFPYGVRPEGIAEAVIDLFCLAVAGLVAQRIYQASSRTGLLTDFVYPLTLLMVAVNYCFLTIHALRFLYDFPALAFFATGVYLIYFRFPAWAFAMLFLVATINRETTLLLLPLYAVAQYVRRTDAPAAGTTQRASWRGLWALRTLGVVLSLCAYWIGWHWWVTRHFAGNASEVKPRLLVNLGILVCPLAWPQLIGVCCYLWPFVFIYRRLVPDPILRAWIWLLPLWFGFMFYYGVFIETRIFGELIPLVACTVMLIAEELLLKKTGMPVQTPLQLPVAD
jgi:hypothetical protein